VQYSTVFFTTVSGCSLNIVVGRKEGKNNIVDARWAVTPSIGVQ